MREKILFIFVFVLFLVSFVNADVEWDECTVIDEEGRYVLTRDVESEETCFTIEADNVVLDCNGHSIIGDGGEGERYFGVYAEGVNGNTITNCEITGFQNGIYFEDSDDNLIEGNEISENWREGIYIKDNSDSNIIKNNIVSENRLDGIIIKSNSDLSTIIDNTIIRNGHSGILLKQSNSNIVKNNRIIENEGDVAGINIQHVNLSKIIDNEINDNRNRGIFLQYSDLNKVINNKITNNGNSGIYLSRSDSNEVNDNEVNDNRDVGIFLRGGSTSNRIITNVVSGNRDDGISISDESNSNMIINNVVSGNRDDGIRISESNSNMITNNIVSENRDGIFLILGEYNIVKNSVFSNNERYGINIEGVMNNDGNNEISNNEISNNGENGEGGIYLRTSEENSFFDNKVTNNNQHGIFLDRSDLNYLENNMFCFNLGVDIEIEESEDEFLYNQFDNVNVDMAGMPEIEGMPCNIEEHTIELEEGWNLISSYLIPYYSNIHAIFGPLARQGKLITVKDEDGRFFKPDFNFNNIPEWNSQEAYYVKVGESMTAENTKIVIKGEENVDTEIQLDFGWNYIAYPNDVDRDMEDIIDNVLDELGDNLIIIKDSEGRFYMPEHGFNNIPSMNSGEGYIVKVSEEDRINFGE